MELTDMQGDVIDVQARELPPGQDGGPAADLVVLPHPLTLEGRTVTRGAELRPGDTLATFLARAGVDLGQGHWAVLVGGLAVPQAMWHRTRPRPGQLVECRRRAAKSALRFVAMVALAYFTVGTGLAAGGLGGFLGFTGFTAFAINAGAMMLGSMLINKLLPPPRIRGGQYDEATGSTYSLTGARNRARPFEPLGLLFGYTKVVPDYATYPWAHFEGEDQILFARFNAGVNVGGVTNLKIGATPIESYSDVEVRRTGFPGSSELLLDWSNVDAVAGALLTAPTAPGAYTVRTSSANTIMMAVDFEAQLYKMDGGGKFQDTAVDINLEYRLLPSGPWTPFVRLAGAPFFDTVTLSSKSTRPVRRTVLTANLTPGQYEVRARKMTADVSTSQQANAVQWVQLKSYQAESAPLAGYPQVGVRIKATGQLNGSLDELSWESFQAPAPRWTGSAWVTEPNSNPGSHMLAFARGFYDGEGRLMAGMGLPDEQIDIESLKAFMVHCTAHGYRFDHWFDSTATCAEVLEALAAAGLGSLSQHSGKLVGVVWASADDAVEAVVNMGNIKAQSFRVDYQTRTTSDELEVTCPNGDGDWSPITVRLQAPGVTAPRETARYAPVGETRLAGIVTKGRFVMAQNLYQRKSVSWEMDLEALDFRRYSVIALSHDLTQWGYSGRLHSAVDVAGTITLTLDAEVPFNAAATLRRVGLRLPGETGMRVFSVAAFSGTTHTLTLASAWPAGVPLPGSSPSNPAHDTLWVWDFKAAPGQRLRVVSIEPAANLGGAKITAVPETDEFWAYVATGTYTVPPSTVVTEPLVASNVQAHQSRNAINYDETALLALTWDVSGPYDHAQVWAAEAGAALQLVGESRTRAFPPTPVWGGVTYNIEVRPFDGLGRLGTVASTSHTVTLDVLTGAAGNYTSFIFKRAATQPATPTGNTPAGWFDGPPANDGNPLWVSIGEFDSANELLGAWSTPVQIDGESLQVEYSVDGTGGWHSEVTTADFWARYRIGTTGPWSVPVKFRGEDGRDAVLLDLTASSFYFLFDSETASTSSDPPITLRARLVNLTGPVTWTAQTFTAAGTLLGNITLGGGATDTTRTLTAAQFNALGTGVNAHHAIITAQAGTLPAESLDIRRTNAGSSAPELRLTNPSHTLPASDLGVVTSYTGAGGTAQFWIGQSLLGSATTPSVAFSIAPGGNPAGLTASIDASTGVYAVTAMPDAVDVATLTLRGTSSNGIVLDQVFTVSKSKAGNAAVTHAFEPRSEIVLPIDSAGNVLSFDLAWTDFVSRQGTGLATGWALSKVDSNCTSTLTGTRIQITAMGTLGQGALGPLVSLATQMTAVGMSATRYQVWDGTKWWISQSESGASLTITGFITTPDMLTYTAVSCGISGRWVKLMAGAGKVIFLENTFSSRVLYTADGGATFALAALPAAMNVSDVKYGDRFMIAPNGGTTGYRSTNGEVWTSVTMPFSGTGQLVPGEGSQWMLWTDSNVYISTNGGDSWGTNLRSGMGVPAGQSIVAMGRFRGLWIALLSSGELALVSSTGAAGSWVKVALEARFSSFRSMRIVNGVLYIIASDFAVPSSTRIIYSTDGGRFRSGALIGGSAETFGMLWQIAPAFNGGYLPVVNEQRYLLSATSDSEGSVAVTATKGSESVTRSLRVAKGTPAALSSYLFAATPGTLLIPTTADGVWLDAGAKSVTAAALKDGADNSSAWTASWVASAGITPSSGTGFTASITAMTVDTGTLTWTLFSPGLPVITGVVSVQKTKGADTSGFKVGTAALPIVHEVASSGSIAFKVTTDGRVMVSRNGAAYTLLVPWYWPITAGIGTNVFFRMTGTGDAVSGDATGNWLQANVDRIWTLSRATLGVSTWTFQLDLSSPTAGANAISAQGSLKLTIL